MCWHHTNLLKLAANRWAVTNAMLQWHSGFRRRSNPGKSLHEFQGSLVCSGAMRKLSNRRSSIPLWKNMTPLFCSIAKTCNKSGKTCKRFPYPKNDADYSFERKIQNNFWLFLVRVYAKTPYRKWQSWSKNTLKPFQSPERSETFPVSENLSTFLCNFHQEIFFTFLFSPFFLSGENFFITWWKFFFLSWWKF